MAVPDVRVGDADRERVARLLRDHCAEGRLDFGELDARVDAVYSATTRRDLDAVVDDLPRVAQPRPAAQAGLWWPGVAVFHVERRLQSPPPTAYEDILRVVVPRMAMAGFDLQADVPPRRLDFRAPGGWRVGVLLHPAADGGTVVAAFGRAPRKVRKAFATLQD
jgi:hypothetical protein